jgi:stearoyl-CoA desaturase (delta-9 desaturase)
MNYGTKVQLLTLTNHIMLFIGIYYTSNWNWLWLGAIMYIFVGLFSANISMHRYLSHKSFETGPIRDKFLKYVSILACFGSPIGWSALHRHHHAHSDTEKDIQNPKEIGAIRSWSSLYPNTNISPRLVGDLLRDRDIKIIHNYYFYFITSIYVGLAIINPMILVWGFVFPAVLSFHGAAAIGVIPHYKWAGYRVVNSKDDSVNSPLASLLSLGEGWHNYHHHAPADYRHGHKWWEADPSAWIIETIFRTSK